MKRKKNIYGFILIIFAISMILVVVNLDKDTIYVNELFIDLDGINITSVTNGLIAHYVDSTGNVWASGGYSIYFKKNETNDFNRISRLCISIGLELFGHFRFLRDVMNRHELLELLVTREGSILVFTAGHIYRSTDFGNTFKKVHQMERFGRGIGRGIMPMGYTIDAKGVIYWGEYFRNSERNSVNIWMSKDDGKSWEIAYSFSPGRIRHIHSVQYDKVSDRIWITTGDRSTESSIGYLEGDDFIMIGAGSQLWRAVSLIFDNEYVYWGTDGTSDDYPENYIVRWSRLDLETEIVATIDSDAFYSASSDSCMIITTDGGGNGATIWGSHNGKYWSELAKWERDKTDQFGTIRIIPQNGCVFYISKINLTGFNNSIVEISFN